MSATTSRSRSVSWGKTVVRSGFSATGAPAPRATARSSTSPSSTLRPAITARSAGATPRHVLFDEVACSAQRKGAHDVLVVGEGGEKDHARRSR